MNIGHFQEIIAGKKDQKTLAETGGSARTSDVTNQIIDELSPRSVIYRLVRIRMERAE